MIESGSLFNFNMVFLTSQSFGTFHPSSSEFSIGTFYDGPNWYSIKHLYYENDDLMNLVITIHKKKKSYMVW